MPNCATTASTTTASTDVSARLLRDWPLPMPSFDADKEVRGHLLIVGGAREMPGAVLLAANAALRAGAGKLSVATAASVATPLALAIPEARVLGLAKTAGGGLLLDGAGELARLAGQVSAVLIGPGMQDEAASAALVRALLPHCRQAPLLLDAAAMSVTLAWPSPDGSGTAAPLRFDSPVLLTPHAGEMAHLSGAGKPSVAAEPERTARQAALRWNAIVVLKGALTCIAAPGGQAWLHQGGNTGLAISGSGDTLAGIIAGLAARGAPLEQAAAWGVALHAMAGEQLALRHGPLGYLARELSAELPALLRSLAAD
ncbi:ADP-dependent NAD(P)H-hydrate dehydratase [Janthinobacterium sp. CG_23.3]|uniref:NAD(P)H-hydrate dehydratase n=1 Tax=Janthinobacterium sp. CG_23.3 TaxID=3349634 RepID=UPI0038D393E2